MKGVASAAEAKKDRVCEEVAKGVAKRSLVTLASGCHVRALHRLVLMLDHLRHVSRGDMKLVIDHPLTAFLTVPANDGPFTHGRRYTPQSVAASWAAANDVGIESCADSTPPEVLADPWARDPGKSIRYWHDLARNIARSIHQDPRAMHVGVFNQWTASTRGVDLSLRYVTKEPVSRVTMHVGSDLPISSAPDIRQAQYDWMLPVR